MSRASPEAFKRSVSRGRKRIEKRREMEKSVNEGKRSYYQSQEIKRRNLAEGARVREELNWRKSRKR